VRESYIPFVRKNECGAQSALKQISHRSENRRRGKAHSHENQTI
jgi:hypothetical protein